MTRNHVSIWNWIQKYSHQKIASKKKKVDEFVVDETVIKVGSKDVCLWVAIESKGKQILALSIPKERNTFVAELFLSGLVSIHGRRPASMDGEHGIHRPVDS